MMIDIYPLTIINDRYTGSYSGGKFTAWNMDYHEIPIDPDDDDVTCATFWSQNKIPVGRGETPEEAVRDLEQRLAADGWIDPAVELPPDDDMVLAIVSGKTADNITLEDAYELASYSAEDGWIVEQFELWETPTVSWWRPLPDPPEKKKED